MVVDFLEQNVHCEDSVMESILKKFYSYMLDLQINPEQKHQLSTSYEAHHISMQMQLLGMETLFQTQRVTTQKIMWA